MRRLAPLAAFVSVAALLLWLSLSEPQPALPGPPASVPASVDADPASSGSALPCAVPLGWRLGEIDPRFGLTPAAAADAVERAAAAWHSLVRAPLFTRDDAAGFPIRFVYDERQERTAERRRAELELEEADRRLEGEAAALGARRTDYERRKAEYDRLRRAFERSVAAHADTVRAWNERGGAPPTIVTAIEAAQARLDGEREALLARGRGLEHEGLAFRADADRYNAALEAQRQRADAVERAFPAEAVESGLYLEAVRAERGTVTAVQREIRVFRFGDAEELRTVLAHELGHALGLGHADEDGAVMSAGHDGRTSAYGPRIRAGDAGLLRARCPRLPFTESPPP